MTLHPIGHLWIQSHLADFYKCSRKGLMGCSQTVRLIEEKGAVSQIISKTVQHHTRGGGAVKCVLLIMLADLLRKIQLYG